MMKILRNLLYLLLAFPSVQAAQHVIIKGAIEETDVKSGGDYIDTHRIPLLAGDFIALVFVSDGKAPSLKYQYHPKGANSEPAPAWEECPSSHGLLQVAKKRHFVLSPLKGPKIPLDLYPSYESLVYAAEQDGVLELRIECSVLFPYYFIIGKDKFSPKPEVIVTGEIKIDDPQFESDTRYRDHILPSVEGGSYMFDVRNPKSERPFSCAFILKTPRSESIIYTMKLNEHRQPIALGRPEPGDYTLRVQAVAQDAKLSKPMPYEIIRWRIPDLLQLLRIEPEKP